MKQDNEPSQRAEKDRSRGFASTEDNAPQAFVDWWTGHDHCPQPCVSPDGVRGMSSGISAHKAWQAQCYRDEFKERRHGNAAGTGVNYAWYEWHKPEDKPSSNPSILARHKLWCIENNKPIPQSKQMPDMLKQASSFDDLKDAVASLVDKFDMNKAI